MFLHYDMDVYSYDINKGLEVDNVTLIFLVTRIMQVHLSREKGLNCTVL